VENSLIGAPFDRFRPRPEFDARVLDLRGHGVATPAGTLTRQQPSRRGANAVEACNLMVECVIAPLALTRGEETP
jgi:hypothetical protein